MNKYLNIPNTLTITRLSLVPIFIIIFNVSWKFNCIAAGLIFLLASLTDYLDGYLARKLQQESAFGKFLDPVADKLIIVVALVLLVQHYASIYFTIPAIIIVCREITVSALREWMAEVGKSKNVTVCWIGKLKTVLQMLAVSMFLAIPKEYTHMVFIAYIFLYIAVILTLWSMIVYLLASRRSFGSCIE